jgi:hypothetical protein
VEQIDPPLTYPNDDGQVEGIRYALLTNVLINAVKEQQEQREELRSAVVRLEKMNQQLLSTQGSVGPQ